MDIFTNATVYLVCAISAPLVILLAVWLDTQKLLVRDVAIAVMVGVTPVANMAAAISILFIIIFTRVAEWIEYHDILNMVVYQRKDYE